MKYLLILLMFCPLCVYAQKDSVLFKIKYKPETVYTTDLETNSDIRMDIKGDSSVKEEMERTGLKFPMHMKAINKNTTETRTGKMLPGGSISYMTEITKGHLRIESGEIIKDQESPLINMKIYGKFDPAGSSEVDSITSKRQLAGSKEYLNSLSSKLLQSVRFPDRLMVKGDTFKIEFPMEIPLNGLNPITVKVLAVYTLQAIQEGIALFDIDMMLGMKTENAVYNMEAFGNGSGACGFNISQRYLAYYFSSLDLSMKMYIQNIIVTMKMQSISVQKTSMK